MTRSQLHGLLLLGTSAAAWVLSLLLPAVAVGGGPILTGFDLLIDGWQGVERGVVAWLANPVFGAAVVLAACGRTRGACALFALSLLLALTSFAAEPILLAQSQAVPDFSFRGGFYVWLAALVAFLAWSWRRVHLQGRNKISARAPSG